MIPVKVQRHSKPDLTHDYLETSVLLGRKTWLFSIPHFLNKTYRVLLNHDWNIVKSAQDMYWLASDNPVIRQNYFGNNEYDFEGGWGNNGTDILFPLSPRYLLHTQVGSNKCYNHISIELKKTINSYIAEHAYRIIFSSRPIKNIETLRSRVIDADTFKTEDIAWTKWHDYHSEAERMYKSP